MKAKKNGMLKKGFFWIPLCIVVTIFVGYLVNISQYSLAGCSFGHSGFFTLSNSIWYIGILPFLVIVYSCLLIIDQREKIRRYRRQFPRESYSGAKRYLEFLLRLPKRYFIPQLAYFMLLLWAIGWELYMIAIWSNYGANENLAEILGYSAMASLDLFVLDINGNILDSIGSTVTSINKSVLKGGIVITAILAAFCSFALVINIFLRSLFSILHTSALKVGQSNSHFYIFYGINEKAIALSNSIKAEDPYALTVFIDTASEDDDNTDGLQSILRMVSTSSPHKPAIELDEKTVLLKSCSDLNECKPDKDLWMSLGLEQMDRLISELCRTTDPKIHIFFLGDNRNQNVTDAKILINAFSTICSEDEIFRNIGKTIYVHNRRESPTAIIEDKHKEINHNITVKLIDESNLAVDYLKREQRFHPVNYVEIDGGQNPGSVKSAFTSLIVGFGETGRDCFRFLYEFSSFVNSSGEEVENKTGMRYPRSPFECHIVDGEVDSIKEHFVAHTPSIWGKDSNKRISDKNIIRFHKCQDNSREFYDMLDRLSERLDYVVVCAGDDELNISIAINVLKYLLRERRTSDKFKILVRAYDKGLFSHLKGVEDYYNQLLGYPYIEVFGSIDQIYNYDSIISGRYLKEAEEYHNLYSSISDKDYPPMEDETYWTTLLRSLDYDHYLKALEHNNRQRKEKGKRPKQQLSKYEALTDIRRKIKENCKNSLHAPTKVMLLQQAIDEFNQSRSSGLHLTVETVLQTITSLDPEWDKRLGVVLKEENLEGKDKEQSDFIKKLIVNLCRTEHLRWNASHELQGFRFDDTVDQDLLHMTHNCLADWEYISESNAYVLNYDYLVVETSIRHHLETSTSK